MTGMNPFLSELYGTAETIGATNSNDTEKLAQAQAMSEMLAGEGIDIDNLSADTIAKVASAIFGEDADLTKRAQEVAEEEKKEEPAKAEGEEEAKESEGEGEAYEGKETPEEEKKEEESAEQKTAEADFLGRMMAHAYVNELAEIEKQAAMPEALAKALAKGKEVGGKALGAIKAAPGKAKEWAEAPIKYRKGLRKDLAHPWAITARKHKGQVAAAGGLAAGAAGGAGLAAHKLMKGKEKKSSVVETLAQQKVAAILEANTDEAKLAGAVDERATEILREMGYEV